MKEEQHASAGVDSPFIEFKHVILHDFFFTFILILPVRNIAALD